MSKNSEGRGFESRLLLGYFPLSFKTAPSKSRSISEVSRKMAFLGQSKLFSKTLINIQLNL